jgi:hypothetical protein
LVPGLGAIVTAATAMGGQVRTPGEGWVPNETIDVISPI